MLSLLLYILMSTSKVLNDIIRRDGAFISDFKVLRPGRMHTQTILMYLDDISLEECFLYCFRHLRCQTVNYSSIAKLCELVDMEFDETEADTEADGWMNYGVPPKIDGGFSQWVQWTVCDRTCGYGTMSFYRTCDKPKPQYGGDYCHGKEVKIESCKVKDCPVDGTWSAWNYHACSVTCGLGEKKKVRPAHGGQKCLNRRNQRVDSETLHENCQEAACPVDGNRGSWHAWKCKTDCTDGKIQRIRECDNPIPNHGGSACLSVGSGNLIQENQTQMCAFKAGVGKGGGKIEISLSGPTRENCALTCLQKYDYTKGITFKRAKSKCVCLFNPSNIDSSDSDSDTEACIFVPIDE